MALNTLRLRRTRSVKMMAKRTMWRNTPMEVRLRSIVLEMALKTCPSGCGKLLQPVYNKLIQACVVVLCNEHHVFLFASLWQ